MPSMSSATKPVPSPPAIPDGSISNFWRCKKCAKVNFRSATLCSGCDQPQPPLDDESRMGTANTSAHGGKGESSSSMLSPASVGYLRSSAAVAVNAKVASLQEMLESQKRKYEGDIVTLRKQLDHALQAHNSLLSSQRQYIANNHHNTPGTARPNSNGGNNSNSNTALETGYQQQITLLQEQLEGARKERDTATNELSTIKLQQQELIGKCEVAATEYAAVMKQLEESEEARNSLLDKLQQRDSGATIEPPVGGSIQGKSSAILNLEREINELKNENENLRSRVTELTNSLDNATSGGPTISSRASADTLKGPGNQSAADISPDDLLVEALRSAIASKSDASIEEALNDANSSIAALRKEVSYLKMSNDGMKKQLDEYETELTELEDREKEKTVEWERERDSLKKKIAQVEKEVQEAEGRERDSCLTMNAMDSILSDALFALKKVDEEKQQEQQQHSGGGIGKSMTFGGSGVEGDSTSLGATVALAGSGSLQLSPQEK